MVRKENRRGSLTAAIVVTSLSILAGFVSCRAEKPLRDAKKYVVTHDPKPAGHAEFKVWRTINIGVPGLRTADEFREALRNGFQTGDWANDILRQSAFVASTTEREINLVVVSV